MDKELKPCPFCGSPARSYTYECESLFSHAAVPWLSIGCSGDCDYSMTREAQDELIDRWNGRLPTPSVDDLGGASISPSPGAQQHVVPCLDLSAEALELRRMSATARKWATDCASGSYGKGSSLGEASAYHHAAERLAELIAKHGTSPAGEEQRRGNDPLERHAREKAIDRVLDQLRAEGLLRAHVYRDDYSSVDPTSRETTEVRVGVYDAQRAVESYPNLLPALPPLTALPDELVELSGKATAGAWRVGQFGGVYPINLGPMIAQAATKSGHLPRSVENEAFIVSLVNWFRSLTGAS